MTDNKLYNKLNEQNKKQLRIKTSFISEQAQQ